MPDFTFPVNDVVAGIFTVLGLDYPAEDTDVGSYHGVRHRRKREGYQNDTGIGVRADTETLRAVR
jgi:hypothetical protein